MLGEVHPPHVCVAIQLRMLVLGRCRCRVLMPHAPRSDDCSTCGSNSGTPSEGSRMRCNAMRRCTILRATDSRGGMPSTLGSGTSGVLRGFARSAGQRGTAKCRETKTPDPIAAVFRKTGPTISSKLTRPSRASDDRILTASPRRLASIPNFREIGQNSPSMTLLPHLRYRPLYDSDGRAEASGLLMNGRFGWVM